MARGGQDHDLLFLLAETALPGEELPERMQPSGEPGAADPYPKGRREPAALADDLLDNLPTLVIKAVDIPGRQPRAAHA